MLEFIIDCNLESDAILKVIYFLLTFLTADLESDR